MAVLDHLLGRVLLVVVLMLQLMVLRLLLVGLVVNRLQLLLLLRVLGRKLLQVVGVLRIARLLRERGVCEEDAEEHGLLDAELLLLFPEAAADVAVVVEPVTVPELGGLVDLARHTPELVLDAGELAAHAQELALGILGVHGYA